MNILSRAIIVGTFLGGLSVFGSCDTSLSVERAFVGQDAKSALESLKSRGWVKERLDGDIVVLTDKNIPAIHDLGDRIYLRLRNDRIVAIKRYSPMGNLGLFVNGVRLKAITIKTLPESLKTFDSAKPSGKDQILTYSKLRLTLWAPHSPYPVHTVCIGESI